MSRAIGNREQGTGIRVAFATLGCKANWVDTETLKEGCLARGFSIVSFESPADVYIVNTCTVTSVADQQSRQMLRKPKRINPEAIVILTGCMGEVGRDVLRSIEGVDAIFGTSDRDAILPFIFKKLGIDSSNYQSPVTNHQSPITNHRFNQSRARAFLKIQDGCNRSCAYCIVPRARGRVASEHPKKIVENCIRLSEAYREIILTGIDISQYGADLGGGANLVSLIELLAFHGDISRLRISSINPKVVTEEFAGLIAGCEKICRHIHLSIQSASDSVLKRMGRGYDSNDVRVAVEMLYKAVPDIAITADVIAGFPGETETEHCATVELLSSMPLAGLHVFPYSEREGTRAATMPGLVPPAIRKQRALELRTLAAGKRRLFLKGLVGKRFFAIVTSKEPLGGMLHAFTDNAVNVFVPHGPVLYGEMGRAVITETRDLKVRGVWDSNPKTKSL